MVRVEQTQIIVENVLIDYMDTDNGTFVFLVDTNLSIDFVITGTFTWDEAEEEAEFIDIERIIELGITEPALSNPTLSRRSEVFLEEYVEAIYENYKEQPATGICRHLGMIFDSKA